MHERLCVSAVSSWSWSFDEDIAFWAATGIDRVELSLRKCADVEPSVAVARLADAGLDVVAVGETGWFDLADQSSWPVQRDRLRRAAELAAAVGAGAVVLLPGRPGPLTWEDAADALDRALAPVRSDLLVDGDVILAIENTSPLRVDLSFVHTLRDAVELADALDLGVCLEVQSCWAERGLTATVAAAGERLALVQVSDAVVGSLSTPDRAVPGDGDVPLAGIVGDVLQAGYRGPFDLELVGPRIEAEGYADAIGRSLRHLERVLEAVTCAAAG